MAKRAVLAGDHGVHGTHGGSLVGSVGQARHPVGMDAFPVVHLGIGQTPPIVHRGRFARTVAEQVEKLAVGIDGQAPLIEHNRREGRDLQQVVKVLKDAKRISQGGTLPRRAARAS